VCIRRETAHLFTEEGHGGQRIYVKKGPYPEKLGTEKSKHSRSGHLREKCSEGVGHGIISKKEKGMKKEKRRGVGRRGKTISWRLKKGTNTFADG